MKYLVALFKKVFCVDFISYLIFLQRMSFVFHENSENKWTFKKVLAFQKYVDKINTGLPNGFTEIINNEINNNQDIYKGYTSQILPNKHGNENDGLTIGFDENGWNANFKVGL